MTRRYGPDAIEKVREANDIVAVVSDYVRLRKTGNTYKGLCPFHSEKTPSFIVSPDKQLFYCFGCAAGGNVINFVTRIENLGFTEALELLAQRAGLQLTTDEDEPPEVRARRDERERLLAIAELAGRFYQQVLLKTRSGDPARSYLAGRGIGEETVRRFQLGFAPNRWDALTSALLDRGIEPEDAVKAGLLQKRRDGSGYYDRFRNRVIFPIRDGRGRVIAFGGRVMTKGEEPKYLNSPETALFHKSQNLFALDAAKEAIRRAGYALIVEGYMDAVTAHQYGYNQAVASLGTSLTEGQARLLARFTSEVRIAYDADSAGQAATWRGLEVLAASGFRVRVVQMPQGEDPDSYLRSAGRDAFTTALEGALGLNDFKLISTLSRFDLSTAAGRVAGAAAVVPLLAGISGLVERAEYQKQAATMLGVDSKALDAEVRAASMRFHSRNNFPSANNNRAEGAQPVRAYVAKEIPGAERDLVKILLLHPEALGTFQNRIGLDGLHDERARAIVAAMLEAVAEGAAAQPADIVGRLVDTELVRCLSELAVERDERLAQVSPEEFMQQYRRGLIPRMLQQLGGRIEEAASRGDLTALNDLLVEYRLFMDRERGL